MGRKRKDIKNTGFSLSRAAIRHLEDKPNKSQFVSWLIELYFKDEHKPDFVLKEQYSREMGTFLKLQRQQEETAFEIEKQNIVLKLLRDKMKAAGIQMFSASEVNNDAK